MAKARLISSDIWADEWFAYLSFFEQSLWIGIFSKCADDQGRLPDTPLLIRAEVYPCQDVQAVDIETALCNFECAGKILRYHAKGKQAIQILNWWEHQHPRWAQPSRLVPPPGWHDAIRMRKGKDYYTENWEGERGMVESYEPSYEGTSSARTDAPADVKLSDKYMYKSKYKSSSKTVQPPPSPSGEPEPSPSRDPLWVMLDRYGVMPDSQIASQSWRDLLEMAGSVEFLQKACQECIDSGASANPRLVSTIIKRCKRDRCEPGQWPNSRKGRASPPKKEPVAYGEAKRRRHPVTGEYIDPTKATVNGQHSSG